MSEVGLIKSFQKRFFYVSVISGKTWRWGWGCGLEGSRSEAGCLMMLFSEEEGPTLSRDGSWSLHHKIRVLLWTCGVVAGIIVVFPEVLPLLVTKSIILFEYLYLST